MISPLHDRKDQQHHVQLNVYYRDVMGDEEVTTLWATSEQEGIDTLRKLGMLLKGNGVDPDRWIPARRILAVDLMDTVDHAQVRAANEQDDEDCPRC